MIVWALAAAALGAHAAPQAETARPAVPAPVVAVQTGVARLPSLELGLKAPGLGMSLPGLSAVKDLAAGGAAAVARGLSLGFTADRIVVPAPEVAKPAPATAKAPSAQASAQAAPAAAAPRQTQPAVEAGPGALAFSQDSGPARRRSGADLTGLSAEAARTLEDVKALPQQAPSETSWKLGRRLWETEGRGGAGERSRVDDRPAGSASAAAAGSSFGAASGETSGADAASTAGRRADAPPTLGRSALGAALEDAETARYPAPPAPEAPASAPAAAPGRAFAGAAQDVLLLAMRVTGQSVLLSEGSSAGAAAQQGAGDLRDAVASASAGGAARDGAASFGAFASRSGSAAAAAPAALPEAELWSSAETAGAVSQAPVPSYGAARRPAPPAPRPVEQPAPMAWSWLLPLAVAALRYRREFI